MATLTHIIDYSEKRGKAKTTQQLEVRVEYDVDDNEVNEVLNVWVHQEGKASLEILGLLNTSPGSLIECLIKDINWYELYRESKYVEAV